MKLVMALDKENGIPVKLINAGSVTEASRRAFQYQCPHSGCSASYHWVRPYSTHGNTEHHDATFARDKDSSHKVNCPGEPRDGYKIHEEIDYISEIAGVTHVRVNFPLGSAKVDKFPQRGYLSEQQLAAAHDQKIITPYGSLGKLTRFLEEKFGSVESEEAAAVLVHYQGNEIEWGKLFKGSDQYDKLYWRTQNHKHSDDGKDTPPIVTVVRPVSEMSSSTKGHARYACEEQIVKINGRKQHIVPVIVCDRFNPNLAAQVSEYMGRNQPMLISARPFHPGMDSRQAQLGRLNVSLYVHSALQLATAKPEYWHVRPETAQLDFFGTGEKIRAAHP